MVFSRAAQQFDEAAEHYEQAAMRLDAVAERSEECVQAIIAGQDGIHWHSPAGQAFTAVTFHHVGECRRRQSRLFEMSASARIIATDLREQAQRARLLAAAVDAALAAVPAAGTELATQALVHGARGASESAEGFLRFVESHGGLPLARLAAAQG
ncbi:hypothetical protein LTI14_03040 [Nesterenkonia sp. YGD6]|uniref:hypothetical protein n=1 Tax=Nesterenkonia sp. YGD6 TaxID=2901231 RepID=UPI001F4D0056|nr:hypothetical protein [Nesterenkonia sp. YGD6]MCH8562199.1 hypothetical protein [Nesterenkonia sp. YGD6]